MKRKIIFGLLLISAMSFSFKPEHAVRHYFKAHVKGNPNETISGYTSTITGNADVLVVFDRTGPDAGVYPVSVDFDVSYEGTVNSTLSFTQDLGNETHLSNWIHLTGTVIDADMGNITPTYY